jgi:hypothetical protein
MCFAKLAETLAASADVGVKKQGPCRSTKEPFLRLDCAAQLFETSAFRWRITAEEPFGGVNGSSGFALGCYQAFVCQNDNPQAIKR